MKNVIQCTLVATSGNDEGNIGSKAFCRPLGDGWHSASFVSYEISYPGAFPSAQDVLPTEIHSTFTCASAWEHLQCTSGTQLVL